MSIIKRIPFTSVNIFGFVVVAMFTALMAAALPHRGLFFAPEKVTFSTIVIAVVFVMAVVIAFTKSLRERYRIPLYLWLMFGYVFYAWLTTFWAANAELAVQGALVDTAAVGMAAMVPLVNAYWRRGWLVVFAFFGPALYLFAMGAALGWYKYTNAIQDLNEGTQQIKNGQMDSVFQYHNTFGVVELAAALVAILLAMHVKRIGLRAWFIANAAVSLVGVVCSYSRLDWLLAVFMILVTWAALLIQRKFLDGFYYLLFSLLIALTASPFALTAMRHGTQKDFLLVLLVTVCGAAVISGVISLLRRIQDTVWQWITASLFIVVPGLVGVFVLHHEASKMSLMMARVHSINLGSWSMRQRFWFYGAARKMWEHSPVFGSGVGTWDAKFQAYQQFPFWSTMAHSVFMSQLVDFGVLGTVLWVAIVGSVGVRAVKGLAKKNADMTILLASSIAGFTLVFHALVDFDMNFPTVSFLFFTLIAMAATPLPLQEEAEADEGHRAIGWFAVPSIGMAVLIFVGTMLSISEIKLQQATSAPNSNAKLADLRAAEHDASYTIQPHLQLAEIYYNNYQQSHSSDDSSKAWTEAQLAAKRGAWDPSVMQPVATIAYQLGHDTKAYQWARRSYTDGKLTFKYASTFMGIALWSGVLEDPHNAADAKKVFESIVQTYNQTNQAVAYLKQLGNRVQPDWQLQVDAPMQVYAATAEYALGNYQNSINDMHQLSKQNQDQNTMGLLQMVALLDEAHLGHHSTKDILSQMQYKSAVLTQEFRALDALHKG